jgi:AcrR family transcriptional regulator
MMLLMRAENDVAAGLRSDARRNRNLLLRAAGEVLREEGLDAPLDEIARRAGVGNATLYRHFPAREDLYEAVFAEAGALLERIRERTLRIEDPWLALAAYFEEACGFFATDRGLSDLMVQGMPRSRALDELRAKCDLLMRTLLERAQRAGVVRPDVGLTDVVLLFCALQRVIPAIELVSPGSWRRHLAITLDGLRPHRGAGLPPSTLSDDQLLEIGQCFHAPRPGDRARRRRP